MGFRSSCCKINGLCHHWPLLGKVEDSGSGSRMKSDRTRKGKVMLMFA